MILCPIWFYYALFTYYLHQFSYRTFLTSNREPNGNGLSTFYYLDLVISAMISNVLLLLNKKMIIKHVDYKKEGCIPWHGYGLSANMGEVGESTEEQCSVTLLLIPDILPCYKQLLSAGASARGTQPAC